MKGLEWIGPPLGAGPKRGAALGLGLIGAAIWWAATAGAGLAGLPRWPGPALGALALLGLARALDPTIVSRRPLAWGGLPRGAVIGVALLMAGGVTAWSPGLEVPALVMARSRLMAGLAPGWWAPGLGIVVALGHEIFFRGALQARLGLLGSTLLWTLTVTPLDPLRGLSTGLALAALSRRCGVEAAVAAHLVWALAPPSLSMGFPALNALGVAGLALALASAPAKGPARLGLGLKSPSNVQ